MIDPADLLWLAEAFGDVGPIPIDLAYDVAVVALARERATSAELASAFHYSDRDGRLPTWSDHDSTVTFDPELAAVIRVQPDRIAITASDVGTGRVVLMRVARELFERHLTAVGGTLVHAAAVAIDGQVVAIAGQRKAGKSTLLTTLVASGAAYVSNDRVALTATEIVGVQTIVSLRRGTLEYVPWLPPLPDTWRSSYPHRKTVAELAADYRPDARTRESWSVSVAQYLDWLGASSVPRGPATAILFPELCDHTPELVPLSPEDTRARLDACRLPTADGLFARFTPPFVPADPVPPMGYRCLIGRWPERAGHDLIDQLSGQRSVAQTSQTIPQPDEVTRSARRLSTG